MNYRSDKAASLVAITHPNAATVAGEPPTAFYPPAVAGTFGAAAAASCLLGLTEDQTITRRL